MSWYSDGEPFDEYDPPYCKRCDGGDSYEKCKRCEERHRKWKEEEEEVEAEVE